jgi:hypothetical protein
MHASVQEDDAMQGGSFEGLRRRCAHQCASCLLGGLLIGPAGLAAISITEAAEAPASGAIASAADKKSADASEKSIIVQNSKGVEKAAKPTASEPPKGEALEPIADAAEYGPELADEPIGSLEPTPADPQAAFDDAPTDRASKLAAGSKDFANEAAAEASDESTNPSSFQAASFSGVTPGMSTRAEVLSQWGDPQESQVGGKTLTYEQESFPAIVVTFSGDRVESVRVQLFEPAKPQSLIAKLGLSDFRTAVIADETGSPVRTIFPERGVTLNHRPTVGAAMATDSKPKKSHTGDGVYEIVMRPIEAGPFLLRAERSPASDSHRLIADL